MWYPTNISQKAVAKIAEKDIPIIKVGTKLATDTFASDFMHSYYKLNYQVPQVKIQPTVFGAIAEGYHFFKPNMVRVVINLPSATRQNWPCIGIRGKFAHIYSCSHYFCNKDLVIAKGFVPKGTIYYLNADGEGVAERIVLTEMTEIRPY